MVLFLVQVRVEDREFFYSLEMWQGLEKQLEYLEERQLVLMFFFKIYFYLFKGLRFGIFFFQEFFRWLGEVDLLVIFFRVQYIVGGVQRRSFILFFVVFFRCLFLVFSFSVFWFRVKQLLLLKEQLGCLFVGWEIGIMGKSLGVK